MGTPYFHNRIFGPGIVPADGARFHKPNWAFPQVTPPCETWQSDIEAIAGPTTLPAQFPALWEIEPGQAVSRPRIENGELNFDHTNGACRRVQGTGDCGGIAIGVGSTAEEASYRVEMQLAGSLFTSGGGSEATQLIGICLWSVGSTGNFRRLYRVCVGVVGDAGGVNVGTPKGGIFSAFEIRRKESGAAEAVVDTGTQMLMSVGDKFKAEIRTDASPPTQAVIKGFVNNTEVLSFTDNNVGTNPEPTIGPMGLCTIIVGSTGAASVETNWVNLNVFSAGVL